MSGCGGSSPLTPPNLGDEPRASEAMEVESGGDDPELDPTWPLVWSEDREELVTASTRTLPARVDVPGAEPLYVRVFTLAETASWPEETPAPHVYKVRAASQVTIPPEERRPDGTPLEEWTSVDLGVSIWCPDGFCTRFESLAPEDLVGEPCATQNPRVDTLRVGLGLERGQLLVANLRKQVFFFLPPFVVLARRIARTRSS